LLSSRRILKGPLLEDRSKVSLPLRTLSPTALIRPVCDEAALRRELETECEQLRLKAREQGFQEGYREGMDRAKQEAAEIRRQALGVLQQAREIYRQTLADLEPQLLNLACAIAERLVAEQLALKEETVVAIAKEALAVVRGRPRITILASPEDAGVMRENLNALLEAVPGSEVTVVEDATLPRGACKIDTDDGLVDASWDVRWEGIRKALRLG